MSVGTRSWRGILLWMIVAGAVGGMTLATIATLTHPGFQRSYALLVVAYGLPGGVLLGGFVGAAAAAAGLGVRYAATRSNLNKRATQALGALGAFVGAGLTFTLVWLVFNFYRLPPWWEVLLLSLSGALVMLILNIRLDRRSVN